MGFIADIYTPRQTSPLLTDKYHFTTAYGYWLEGRADNNAVFYMFGRKEALGGGYSVAGGLEGVIDIVQRWQQHGFLDEDIAYLRAQKTASGQPQFPEAFLAYLKSMTFRLKIDAAPEGSVFFPQEPVLRVEGPIAQVKMLESVALGIINGHSGYMTQAARQADAVAQPQANGSPQGSASVQGLRRGPGLGAAIEASRSLGFGGYTSTSTGTAARDFGQPFVGTMDHAWVMTHGAELGQTTLAQMFALRDAGEQIALKTALAGDAFRSFAFAHPESGILLLDTYDPLQGLENAITVIKELRALGLGAHYGVRFDSGDIVAYSKIALRRFAQEGFIEGLTRQEADAMDDAALLLRSADCSVFCAAADGISEHSAQEMRAQGAFFKSWGIGTAGSHVAPLGLVYKASSVYMDVLDGKPAGAGAAMTPVMKVASNAPVKSSNPGKINARRFYSGDGKLSHVVLYDETLGMDNHGPRVNLRDFSDMARGNHDFLHRDLLVPVFDAAGALVYRDAAQKESWPGSGRMVTDLGAMAQFVRRQLDTLPHLVRRFARGRDEVLKSRLLAAFNAAEKSGDEALTLALADLRAGLPPQQVHVPVYLDQRLFDQRMACEGRHLAQARPQAAGGMGAYRERFEK